MKSTHDMRFIVRRVGCIIIILQIFFLTKNKQKNKKTNVQPKKIILTGSNTHQQCTRGSMCGNY